MKNTYSRIAQPGAFLRHREQDIMFEVTHLTEGVVVGMSEYPDGQVFFENNSGDFQRANKPDDWTPGNTPTDLKPPFNEQRKKPVQMYQDKSTPKKKKDPSTKFKLPKPKKVKTVSKYSMAKQVVRENYTEQLTFNQALPLIKEKVSGSNNMCRTYFYKAKNEISYELKKNGE